MSAVDEAKAAAELVEWWDTGVLPDGVVRAEAQRRDAAGDPNSGYDTVRCVERDIINSIVRKFAASPTPPAVSLSGGDALREKIARTIYESVTYSIVPWGGFRTNEGRQAYYDAADATLAALASTPPVLPKVDERLREQERNATVTWLRERAAACRQAAVDECDDEEVSQRWVHRMEDYAFCADQIGAGIHIPAALDAPHTGEVLGG